MEEQHPPPAVIDFIDQRYADIMTHIKGVALDLMAEQFGDYEPGQFEILANTMLGIWIDYTMAN